MTKNLDEVAVRQILDRAVQIDASSRGLMGPDDVHAIAKEMGLEPDAVRQALAEHERGSTDDVAAPRGQRASRTKYVAMAAVLLALAAAFALVRIVP